ncbi:cupin domain-containing protein [Treponema sp.]
MVRHEDDVQSVPMSGDDIKGVSKQILIGPKDGYDCFLRVFTVQSGGHTPDHNHPWYHANYVLEGEGQICMDGKQIPVKAGSVAYIEEGKTHHFENTGKVPLRFICLVPESGDKY